MVKTISPTGLSFRNISFKQRGGAKTSYPWPWSAAGTVFSSKVWKDCEDDLWDCMRLIPGKKTYVFGCWTVGQMPFFPTFGNLGLPWWTTWCGWEVPEEHRGLFNTSNSNRTKRQRRRRQQRQPQTQVQHHNSNANSNSPRTATYNKPHYSYHSVDTEFFLVVSLFVSTLVIIHFCHGCHHINKSLTHRGIGVGWAVASIAVMAISQAAWRINRQDIPRACIVWTEHDVAWNINEYSCPGVLVKIFHKADSCSYTISWKCGDSCPSVCCRFLSVKSWDGMRC